MEKNVVRPSVEKATHKVTMLYAGDFVGQKGQRYQRWYVVDGLENDGSPFPERFSEESAKRSRTYTKFKRVSAIVGDVFEFQEDDESDGTISTGTAKRAGRWMNENDVAGWRASDLATDAELDARKKSRHDDLLAKLEPFREAYRRLGPGIGRSQFLAKIVAKIVG